MPCNSDYLEPNDWERQLSRVATLHDELDGKWSPESGLPQSYWRGFHPRVYGKPLTKEQRDEMVADLCNRLQTVNVRDYSLEMQIWWRDHQEADRKRLHEEGERQKELADKEELLSRLTPYERKLLGYS